MKKTIAAVVLSVLVLWSVMPVFAAEGSWLVGKWELSYDPDGNEKDWIEFTKDGEAFSISPNGRRVPGQYIVTDSEIGITYSFNGKTIPMALKFTPDKKKLLAYSKRTGKTSEYQKIK